MVECRIQSALRSSHAFNQPACRIEQRYYKKNVIAWLSRLSPLKSLSFQAVSIQITNFFFNRWGMKFERKIHESMLSTFNQLAGYSCYGGIGDDWVQKGGRNI